MNSADPEAHLCEAARELLDEWCVGVPIFGGKSTPSLHVLECVAATGAAAGLTWRDGVSMRKAMNTRKTVIYALLQHAGILVPLQAPHQLRSLPALSQAQVTAAVSAVIAACRKRKLDDADNAKQAKAAREFIWTSLASLKNSPPGGWQ